MRVGDKVKLRKSFFLWDKVLYPEATLGTIVRLYDDDGGACADVDLGDYELSFWESELEKVSA